MSQRLEKYIYILAKKFELRIREKNAMYYKI